ncbi:hypothetical protein CLV28_2187 [Sediminihabitans luteus]|uniref:Uncharacterized protein n=1 Tax=Sediminihabitans luteus TaxID=1138585 RepID=A0A2M9CEN3_9CELL|nr:hypothetical protein [Sediminihabitans luteus]PJJ70353.1 hypothetical protein CLV28_2187 [Sediminihabitans luteus]GII97825.1 hypothetical protein Slu03_02030 [Sediminihabitans luteus]
MLGVRWDSLATVLGCGVLALVALLLGVLRGHPWAWVPCLLCAGIALREVRLLQRERDARNDPARHDPARRDPERHDPARRDPRR